MASSKAVKSVKSKSIQAVQNALNQLNHATAQEVLEWIQRSAQSPDVSLTSVYRALNHLVEESIIKPLHFNDGQVRYELNSQHMHHHHFVCTQCNSIQIVDVCPFESYSQALQQKFHIQYHTFEVFGLCHPCHQNNTEAPASQRLVQTAF
ncbi:MAG: transcriptional repressor [Cyanobacteria bacterium]|nr:transcriptional repressor [Cyanobacteriota bacterium]